MQSNSLRIAGRSPFFFFVQAEDGIRVLIVTGVQTCALPIYSLASVIRGTGNMALPAVVTCVGVVILVPLSPALIFGWGPFPALGIAGGAVALVFYYALGCLALAAYLWSGRSVVRPSLRDRK